MNKLSAITITFVATIGALAATTARAQDDKVFNPQTVKTETGIDPHLGDALPLDVMLKNEAGQNVRLNDYFNGQPVILMPVYYRCPMLCGLELNGLVRCLRSMELTPGADFQIVTFSIDPRETPPLAREKKKSYLQQYERPGAEEGWHFLTGEQDQITRLCEAVGFRYAYNEQSGEYAHAAGLMICTPDGRLARYFYGIDFSQRDMRLALVEASENDISTVTDQVLLYCFMYDPTTGKYGLAIMNILRVSGIATVVVMAAAIGVMLRKDRGGSASPQPLAQGAGPHE